MPPRSLKYRLLLSFLVSMTVILAGGGVAIYQAIAQHLDSEHDDLLRQRLLFYETTVKVVKGRGGMAQITNQITPPEADRIASTGNPDLAMGWRMDNGEVVLRSAPLYGAREVHEVPRPAAQGGEVSFADWTTWDRRPARLCTRVFTPAKESADLPDMPVQVVVGRDLLSVEQTLGDVRRFLIKTGVAVMLAVLVASAILIRRGVKPLVSLARQIGEHPPAGEGGEPFSLPGAPLELQPVVGRLNALMDRVGDAIEHERQFANNAAHELRNPLAAIRSTIEATLHRTRSTEEYEEALDSIWLSQQGMQRIVDHLLLLARLESGHQHTEFLAGPVALGKMLKKAWRGCFDRAHEKQLRVTWHVDEPAADPVLAESLTEIVVSNMLDNAVNYTPAGGSIAIHAAVADGQCRVRVENTNPGLTTEQMEQSFAPFWRADPNASGHRGNAGIGLALCRRIAATLDGAMRGWLSPEEGMVCYEAAFPCRVLPPPQAVTTQ